MFDDSVSYAEKTMKGQKLMNLPRPKVFTPNKTEDSDYYLARRRKSFFIVFYWREVMVAFSFVKIKQTPRKAKRSIRTLEQIRGL